MPAAIDPVSGLGDLAGVFLPNLGNVAAAALDKLRIRLHDAQGGWTVEVVRRGTPWRADRVVHSEDHDDLGTAIDRVHAIAGQISNGVGRLHW